MENPDQDCLKKWITAGLQIDGVRQGRGDSFYLLCNMIAKYSLASSTYHVSAAALNALHKQGISIEDTHKRSKFYGRGKPYIYEHAVPASITRRQLLLCCELPDIEINVGKILEESGPVVILLRKENEKLHNLKLRHKMPASWSWGDSVFQRYVDADIKIAEEKFRMDGALRR